MAAPLIAITVDDVVLHRRSKTVKLAFQMYQGATGGTDVTGATGETVDLTTATNSKGLQRGKLASTPLPGVEEIQQVTFPLGFTAALVRAAASPTLKNYKLVIYKSMGTVQDTSYNATLCPAALADAPKIVFAIKQKLNQ